jgi:hypothetical protein
MDFLLERIYAQKGDDGRTTIVSYMMSKMYELLRKQSSYQRDVIKAANSLNIKDIQSATEGLNKLVEDIRDLNREIAEHLDVADILRHKDYLSPNDIAYTYQYSKSITIQERDALSKWSYQFRDAKVK